MISDKAHLGGFSMHGPTDDDLSINLDLGKSESYDVQNSGDGDSGASISLNNNSILSPILSSSSGAQFSDNLILTPPISQVVMEGSMGQKDEESSPLQEDSKTLSNLYKQLEWMQRNMEMLKKENASLENTLASTLINPSPEILNSRSFSDNPAFIFSNFKMEMASFKSELSRITSSLESCELCRKSFLERWSNSLSLSLQQMRQSLNELLLKNFENPVEEMNSLVNRLKSTEERLKRTRMDVSDSLSKVEEKILIENVELKISESETKQKLQQSVNQIQAMRKSHQGLMEVCQRLKVRSSENGFIDFQELLKRFPVEDLNLKQKEESISKEVLQQIREDITKQITALVNEKHFLSSELSGFSDEINLLKKENDGLRKSLNDLNSTLNEYMIKFCETRNSTIDKILRQMELFTKEAKQLCRCGEAASDTIKVLEEVLNTKERLLSSSMMELEKYKANPPKQFKQKLSEPKRDSEHLSAILEFMKFKTSNEEGSSALHKTEVSPSVGSASVEHLKLNEKCLLLEHELEFAEKNQKFQKEEVESLQAQLNSSRDNLRQKTQELEISVSNESDLRRELKMNREWLDALNAQLIEKEKQIKLLELDKGSVQRLLEKDGTAMETNESNGADVKFIKHALELDLMASRNTLDDCLKENIFLKKSLEQVNRDLAAERDVTSAATFDKLIIQQQFYAAKQEVDALLKEMDDVKRKNSLLQLENQKLSNKPLGQNAEPGLQERIKSLSFELMETKKKLELREKDCAFFQDTLKFMLKSSEDSQTRPEAS